MSHLAHRLALAVAALAVLGLIGLPLTHAQSIHLYLPLGAKRLAQATVHPTVATAEPSTPHPGTPHPTYPPHDTPTPGTPHPTSPPHDTPTPATPCPTQPPHQAAAPVVVVPRGIELDAWYHDGVQIRAVTVTGDTLALTVSYGGGCVHHDLWLVASGLLMESAPPQADLFLSHNAYGDACRAIIRRDLAFDLAPLKRTATGGAAAHGTLILRLRGWPEGIRYDY
jgi:hypothetical protein